MPFQLTESETIQGVYLAHLQPYADDRGRFMESFRKEWFPQRSWNTIQTNRSESRANVLRGLHYHFHQVDYWCVMQGRIQAALLDIRPDSPTFRQHQTVAMGGDDLIGLFIPVGVAHGFAALTDVILTYIVDNYYDNSDEHGVAWNDPAFNIDWGVADPLISPRDAANRCLADIPPAQLPHMRHSLAASPHEVS